MAISNIAKKLPLKAYLRIYEAVRDFAFRHERVDTICVRVKMTAAQAERMLARHHFTRDFEFSYNYEGEDLNMRRTLYKDDEYEWYQLHVRGFEVQGGEALELQGHTELTPTDHPNKHIDNVNLSRRQGLRMIKSILKDENIEYEIVDNT